MKFCRIIFLDIDGVLHAPDDVQGARPPLKPQELRVKFPLALKHLPILRTALNGYRDVGVVIISSWRMFFSADELAELFAPLDAWFSGGVPKPYAPREESILEWLSEHPDVTDFVVIDDTPSYFKKLTRKLISPTPMLGLEDEAVMPQLKSWLLRPHLNIELHESLRLKGCLTASTFESASPALGLALQKSR